jgi:hypothetical protein
VKPGINPRFRSTLTKNVTVNKQEDKPEQEQKDASSWSSSAFSQDEPTVICEDCDEPAFRSHQWCISHLVGLYWPQLGPTWTKGSRVAARWYAAHPGDFEEQLREVTVAVLPNSQGIEAVVAEENAAPAPRPDLGGGRFRCDRWERMITLADVAMDGQLHRGYDYRDEKGVIEHRRCGGTWERIDYLDEMEELNASGDHR